MPHTWQAETGQLDNENATTQGEVLDNEQSQVQVDTVTKTFGILGQHIVIFNCTHHWMDNEISFPKELSEH